MEVEPARRDAAALDLELLQLAELAPGALRENSIADALYAQWLVLPETTKLVPLQRVLSPSLLVALVCAYISLEGSDKLETSFLRFGWCPLCCGEYWLGCYFVSHLPAYDFDKV
jgi:hypothetical protein